MKSSLISLVFFFSGIITAYYRFLPEFILKHDFSIYALYLLMFLVGVVVGSDLEAFTILKRMKYKILLIPLATIIGTTIGVLIASLFIDSISAKEAAAVGCGFGYYSLSSIYIAKISGETLGVIALIANILREIFTLFFSPFLHKYFGVLAPIMSGGATSMDSTLPAISRTSGKKYVVISIFHGVVLTLLVPFLVPLILT